MTKQTYKSAQGKIVDLGTIKLRNEYVRAVGNMNVNARGDVLDSNNQVVETKSRQIQKQNARLTNVVDTPVHTSSAAARRARNANPDPVTDSAPDPVAIIEPNPVTVDVSEPTQPVPATGGGLAAAIARSKIIKQEKEKTARQIEQQKPGVRKI
jgi:hypothetical protein